VVFVVVVQSSLPENYDYRELRFASCAGCFYQKAFACSVLSSIL